MHMYKIHNLDARYLYISLIYVQDCYNKVFKSLYKIMKYNRVILLEANINVTQKMIYNHMKVVFGVTLHNEVGYIK